MAEDVVGRPSADACGGEDPRALFGLRLDHVGINAGSAEEATDVAERFATLMGLAAHDTPISVFSADLVETMKGCGRGTHGHIGFSVTDMVAAERWFAERGFTVNEESRAYFDDGTPKLVYFTGEIGGFAIHLLQAR